jgi:hypothetical protein
MLNGVALSAGLDGKDIKMNFGQALEHLKNGNKVQRSGWNGKGMFIVLVRTDDYFDDEHGFPLDPYLAMKTASDTMQPGWLASQADMLADDWQIVAS